MNKAKSRGNEDEDVPATGQARQFYYGADEESCTIASKDFDDAYDVSGQSQVLRNLRGSKPMESSLKSSMYGSKKQLTFGKDELDSDENDLGSDQEMIEASTSTMVNMAISMDPLTA